MAVVYDDERDMADGLPGAPRRNAHSKLSDHERYRQENGPFFGALFQYRSALPNRYGDFPPGFGSRPDNTGSLSRGGGKNDEHQSSPVVGAELAQSLPGQNATAHPGK